MSDAWFYKVNGQEQGPVPFDDISAMAQSGRLSRSDEIRFGHTADWMTAESVGGLFAESDEPEAISNLDDLNFSFENQDAPATNTQQSVESNVQTIDDISELNDLSELNINLVTEEPLPRTARAPHPAPAESSPPTVTDDRVVAPIDLAESWFYQSLGQELGPMSFEELCGLAESGALSSSDLVKKGTADDWKPAETNTVLSMLLKAAALPAPPAPVSKPAPKKKQSRQNRSAAPAKSTTTEAQIDAKPTAPPQADPAPPAVEPERWYCKIDGVEHGPLEFDDLKGMAARQRLNRGDQVKLNDDGQWVLATTVTGLFAAASPMAAPAAMPSAAMPSSPAMSGGMGSYTPGASPKPPRASKAPKTKRVKAAREPLFSNLGEKKPLLIGGGVIVGLVALVLAIGLMSSSSQSREYHATLQEIYNAHVALREKKASDQEWQPLIARADGLQKTMVASLKKTASAKNRADQALLFAARDYLPGLLKDSHKEPTRNEDEFKRNLDIAGKLLGTAKK